MIMQKKDFRKGMIVRLWNGHSYRVIEEIKKNHVETTEGKKLVISSLKKVVELENKRTNTLSRVYYDIRTVWNATQTKMIAKRKHPDAELKIE